MKDQHDTERVVRDLLNHSIEKGKDKSRAFKHQKQLPLPKSDKSTKKLQRTVVAQQSAAVLVEQRCCVPNQNYPLLHLEALKQRRISMTHAKEKWIATRHFRLLSSQMQQWIYMQLRHQIHACQQDPALLSYLIERREERHFQIDRIIKYLSH